MKRRIYLALFSAFWIVSHLSAQPVNLAGNGSFESIGADPTGPGELSDAIKWTNCNGQVAFPFGTPDLFTNAGSGGTQWPNTFAGTVVPQSGNALAGFITSNFFVPDFREYTTYHLESAMVPGQAYNVSFWLTNGSANWYGARGSNNIGVALTLASPVQIQHEPLLSVVPQLELTTIIHHTVWQQYNFTFTPAQPFEYLTIGNFRTDAATSIGTFTSGSGLAYYFLDNVAVVAAAPLPVEALNLHQTGNETALELEWSLPQSTVGDELMLERSMDQHSFVLVSDFGRIEKAADGMHFVDKDALPGLSYFYRLRDVSANGTVSYSKMVSAAFGGAQEYVAGRLYPNPARERFFLEFTAIVAGNLEMQLIDGTGRLVQSQIQNLSAGQPSAAFELPVGLTSGVYHAKFDFKGQHFSHKVVVAAQD